MRAVEFLVAVLAAVCALLVVLFVISAIVALFLAIWTVGDDSGRWFGTAAICAIGAIVSIFGVVGAIALGDR